MLTNLNPARIHKNILEFYLSSGMIDQDPEPVSIQEASNILVRGNSQAYEQVFMFVYSHLVPDFCPFTVSFKARDSWLLTRIHLPEASYQAYYQVFEGLSQNNRLSVILANAGGKLRTSLDPALIILDWPVEHDGSLQERRKINIADLRHRLESLDVAPQLFEGFFGNSRRHLDLLRQALGKANWEEAYRNIHALKGGALNLGATDLVNLCLVLENSIKSRDFSGFEAYIQRVPGELAELEEEYQAIKEQLSD